MAMVNYAQSLIVICPSSCAIAFVQPSSGDIIKRRASCSHRKGPSASASLFHVHMLVRTEKATGQNICITFSIVHIVWTHFRSGIAIEYGKMCPRLPSHLGNGGKFSISNWWCFHMCLKPGEREMGVDRGDKFPFSMVSREQNWLFLAWHKTFGPGTGTASDGSHLFVLGFCWFRHRCRIYSSSYPRWSHPQ